MNEFEFKCSKCGLCQDDKGMGDYICKEDNETVLDLFQDEEPVLVTDESRYAYRFSTYCENDWGSEILVDVTGFYHTDTIYGALKAYCRQEKGLDAKNLHLGQRKDGNDKWKDVFLYESQMIGSYLDDCIKELDKAKTGQDYGKPFFDED